MGGQISFVEDPDELLQRYFPHFKFTKMLNPLKLRTFMCTSPDEGQLVSKLISTDDPLMGEDNVLFKMKLLHNTFDLQKQPNVITLEFKDLDLQSQTKYFLAIRQYVDQSLRQRLLSKIPGTQTPEKKWFAFQAMCAVSQMHQKDVVHGDIKPENMMISSFNQLYLTDYISFQPTCLQEDDLTSYNNFYGELDNNKPCYFAPERFVKKERFDDSFKAYNKLVKSMDIFSLGCVIAEIFMNGHLLFDLTRLQQYRRGTFNPKEELKQKIVDPVIIELIMRMIDLNPDKRPDIFHCLNEWNSFVMPKSFPRCFFQIGSAFVRPQFIYSDCKISLLRKYMPSVWRSCFDPSAKPNEIFKKFKEPIERVIFEKLREDSIIAYNGSLIPCSVEGVEFNFLEPASNEELSFQTSIVDKESILIVIHWIGVFLSTCYYPQSKRVGLEMLMILGRNSSLQIRLQYVLPYILKCFEDKQSKVQVKAIEAAVLLFEDLIDSTEEHYLSGTDFKVFDNYIMPEFQKIKQKNQLVQITFTKYMPTLAKIGQKFTEISVSSRLARQQQQSGNQHSSHHEQDLRQSEMVQDMQDSEWPVLGNSTIETNNVIKPRNESKQEEDRQVQQDKIFINYDQEIEAIRKQFISIIEDFGGGVSSDISIMRLLFARLGQMCDFFGNKWTMDKLIPQLTTIPNKKEFLIKQEALTSVTGVGIKAGKRALWDFMLIPFNQFLYDSEELVVLEIIRTFRKLITLKLITKEYLFEKKYDPKQQDLLDKILPFLMHPNTWIREETVNFILTLVDFENTKLLSKVEAHCKLGNKLRPYLKQVDKVNVFLFTKQETNTLLDLLRPPLSREIFEQEVKQLQEKPQKNQSDEYALEEGQFENVLKETKMQYKKDNQLRMDNKQQNKQGLRQNKITQYNHYRVVRILTLEELSKTKVNHPDADSRKNNPTKPEGFMSDYYQTCNRISNSEEQNMGINVSDPNISQIEFIMQAMNLLPDDDAISQITYQNQNIFTTLSNQSMFEQWRLQVEKLSSTVAQPSEIPTFHHLYSKTTSIETSPQNSDLSLTFCPVKKSIEDFRPKGRLLTTLYEHKNPVNCLTVTDDQSMFFTASRADGLILGWDTSNMTNDAVPPSKLRLESNSIVNSITTLQNSKFLCLAGKDSKKGMIEIHQINDLQSQRVTNSLVCSPDHNEDEGEMMNCLDTMLPVTYQHLLAYTSQKGTMFLHDLRCKKSALVQKNTFETTRGLLTCMTQGQDPYQLICGSIGGYVMIYDIRFDMVVSSFKHSQKYPILSIANFKPTQLPNTPEKYWNRSTFKSPMALVATGSPNYELSLIDLDSGNIEYLMSVNEPLQKDQQNEQSIQIPAYYRESLLRDSFDWPEKSETYQSLYRRYLMQSRSLVSPNQIKLTQNIDEEIFKASKNRFKLVKQANDSLNACRKVIVPRKNSNVLQGMQTAEYAITGGNDKRIRFWNLNQPANLSYYVNTPDNDECQYFQEIVAGGTVLIKEQVSKIKTFPPINGSLLQGNKYQSTGKLTIPNTSIELSNDSLYYSVLQNLIMQGNTNLQDLTSTSSAKRFLTQSTLGDINSGVAHQFQIDVGQMGKQKDKIIVYNFNGLSEWQHLNGLCATEGNVILHNSSYNDMWSQEQKNMQNSTKRTSVLQDQDQFLAQAFKAKLNQENPDLDKVYTASDYLYRESQNVSHSDAILDMMVLDTDSSAMLITGSRDGTVKLWV